MRLRQGCRGMWIALAAALADRLSKAAVAALGAPGPLIPGVINLLPVRNRGMAFSMFSGQALALTVLTAVISAGLTLWLLTHPQAPGPVRAGLWLIVGGGLGNLYDRLTLGSVMDFIDLAFMRFAVFNIADACICVGAAVVVVGVMGDSREQGTGNREQGTEGTGNREQGNEGTGNRGPREKGTGNREQG